MKYLSTLSFILLTASSAAAITPIDSPPKKKACMTCEITCDNARGRSFHISVYQQDGCPTPGQNFDFASGSVLVQCESVSSSAEIDTGECICPFTPCQVTVKAEG